MVGLLTSTTTLTLGEKSGVVYDKCRHFILLRVGVHRREHCDITEQATNWFNNGSVLEDRPVSCQIPFTYRRPYLWEWLRRFRHMVGYTILFLPPK